MACKSKKIVVKDYRIAQYEEIASGFHIPDGIEIISENEFLFVDRTGKSITIEKVMQLPFRIFRNLSPTKQMDYYLVECWM